MFDGFWNNVLRYIRYFVTTMLGVLLNTFAPLGSLVENRVTLVALVGLLTSVLVFLTLTLRAMLGLSTI